MKVKHKAILSTRFLEEPTCRSFAVCIFPKFFALLGTEAQGVSKAKQLLLFLQYLKKKVDLVHLNFLDNKNGRHVHTKFTSRAVLSLYYVSLQYILPVLNKFFSQTV